MLRDLVQSWWLLNIRGFLTVAFGAFLWFLAGTMQDLFTTAIALVGVMLIFVFYILASGALSIAAAFKIFGARERFWALVLHGGIMLALGFWLLFSNRMTEMWLVWFTVANAFGSGLLEIMLARAMRRHLDSMLLTVAGTGSVGAAMLLIFERNAQMSALVLLLGFYAVFYGAVLVIFSLRLQQMSRHLHLAHHH